MELSMDIYSRNKSLEEKKKKVDALVISGAEFGLLARPTLKIASENIWVWDVVISSYPWWLISTCEAWRRVWGVG